MSNFCVETKHPETGEWEMAWWLDNYFGPHLYGVQFDLRPLGMVYDPREIEFKTRVTTTDLAPKRRRCHPRELNPKTRIITMSAAKKRKVSKEKRDAQG